MEVGRKGCGETQTPATSLAMLVPSRGGAIVAKLHGSVWWSRALLLAADARPLHWATFLQGCSPFGRTFLTLEEGGGGKSRHKLRAYPVPGLCTVSKSSRVTTLPETSLRRVNRGTRLWKQCPHARVLCCVPSLRLGLRYATRSVLSFITTAHLRRLIPQHTTSKTNPHLSSCVKRSLQVFKKRKRRVRNMIGRPPPRPAT